MLSGWCTARHVDARIVQVCKRRALPKRGQAGLLESGHPRNALGEAGVTGSMLPATSGKGSG